MVQRSFESELDYQRFICKDAMRRGRATLLDVLPKIAERATELLENLKKYGDANTHMNNDDLYKWFQTYTDEIRKANTEWYEASQKMKILDSLEAALKRNI